MAIFNVDPDKVVEEDVIFRKSFGKLHITGTLLERSGLWIPLGWEVFKISQTVGIERNARTFHVMPNIRLVDGELRMEVDGMDTHGGHIVHIPPLHIQVGDRMLFRPRGWQNINIYSEEKEVDLSNLPVSASWLTIYLPLAESVKFGEHKCDVFDLVTPNLKHFDGKIRSGNFEMYVDYVPSDDMRECTFIGTIGVGYSDGMNRQSFSSGQFAATNRPFSVKSSMRANGVY